MVRLAALIGDMLIVAQAQLRTSAEDLLRSTNLYADPRLTALFKVLDEADPAPSTAEVAASFGAWIVRNQPFSKDNWQIGYRFMRMMLREADLRWPRSKEDAYVVAAVFKALESGAISEVEFIDWVCLRVEQGERTGSAA